MLWIPHVNRLSAVHNCLYGEVLVRSSILGRRLESWSTLVALVMHQTCICLPGTFPSVPKSVHVTLTLLDRPRTRPHSSCSVISWPVRSFYVVWKGTEIEDKVLWMELAVWLERKGFCFFHSVGNIVADGSAAFSVNNKRIADPNRYDDVFSIHCTSNTEYQIWVEWTDRLTLAPCSHPTPRDIQEGLKNSSLCYVCSGLVI